jgi:hypothetical protein
VSGIKVGFVNCFVIQGTREIQLHAPAVHVHPRPTMHLPFNRWPDCESLDVTDREWAAKLGRCRLAVHLMQVHLMQVPVMPAGLQYPSQSVALLEGLLAGVTGVVGATNAALKAVGSSIEVPTCCLLRWTANTAG